MPQKPHKRWTPVEDELLRKGVVDQLSKGPLKDWQSIASNIPGRTNKDCRKRWHNVVSGGMKKGHWTQSEDQLLTEAIEMHGENWTAVAAIIKTRNADQCSKRWKQFLDPELNRSRWNEEDNVRLLEAYSRKGSQWKQIQTEYFPTRSRTAIKNQYTIVSRRQAVKEIKVEAESHVDENVKDDRPARKEQNRAQRLCKEDNEPTDKDVGITDMNRMLCDNDPDDEDEDEDDGEKDDAEDNDDDNYHPSESVQDEYAARITNSSWNGNPMNQNYWINNSSLSHMTTSHTQAVIPTPDSFPDFGVRGMSSWLLPEFQAFGTALPHNHLGQSLLSAASEYRVYENHQLPYSATGNIFLSERDLLYAQSLNTAPSSHQLGMSLLDNTARQDFTLATSPNETVPYPERITLTVYHPTGDTVDSLMQIALANQSRFQFDSERSGADNEDRRDHL